MLKAAPLCGQRWIRTTEGVSQQIYSLPHLATLVFALISIQHPLQFPLLLMSLGNGCKVRHYFLPTKHFSAFFQEKLIFLTKAPFEHASNTLQTNILVYLKRYTLSTPT